MLSEATETTGPAPRGHLAESAGGESSPSSWLLCRAGPCLHALPLQHVIETMRVLPIEAVSAAPRYVRGLCIIRGMPVPVVDPGLLLDGHETQPGRLVTIRVGGRVVAIATEAVLGIRVIAAQECGQLPPLLDGAADESIAAIGTLDAELLFFLRAARIVPQELLDRLGVDEAAS